MNRVPGVVVGIVRDIDDPIGEGRVRVQFPWLSDDELSGWAPIVRTMAGGQRGFWYMPELDDEALVAFEHGSFDHPFVVGFLHNGVDLPPDDGIDASVRRLRTVSGHVLEFDDRTGQERILLRTAAGQEIVLQDVPGRISLTTASGTTVVLDDTPSSVQVTTTSGASVVLSESGAISLTAPGTLDLTVGSAASITVGSGATITTGGACTVTAGGGCMVTAPTVTVSGGAVSVNSAITTFAGVVQCSTLITNAVVSASYTPGVGNVW